MITVKINRKEIKSLCIEIQGHANYAEYGNDIVCASVSTAAIMTANLIEKLKLGYNIIDLVCESGYFRLVVNGNDYTTCMIFENLEYTLDDIQKQYPKYIKYKN